MLVSYSCSACCKACTLLQAGFSTRGGFQRVRSGVVSPYTHAECSRAFSLYPHPLFKGKGLEGL
ncbi:hypothetical protein B9Q12_02805 [Candidatus Marsarchaeota G2 archaeon ECH_B_SAG-G06]|uniref:Uncharacterized protein n=1 Tax=Candidatus Marsarchaeota G2 archaeon ECH_B_SAG-G06 TaxID=1978166 RepID=A0A2R6BZY0_9ARCH|nr:MAG: hypothetical protein B9Q12_02805 [Candidatus Marsarchaeota G2 archaeon ECH_B_SAG-G06]